MLVVACAPSPVDRAVSAVVFGTDDRREPHEVAPAFASIAREQVATRIVDWAIDFADPSAPRIVYERTLGESLDLCEGEPFADQIAPGSCSATLIDERHLLTAAHCVSTAADCEASSHHWVFGFHVDASGLLAPLGADDVYRCARVVVSDAREDYSVLELDREVRGREPVDVALHESGLAVGTPVTLIGFPDGVPVKVDSGGRVTFSAPGRYFRATSDAFDSSSGSGVFDGEGRLVGILQRGYPDYVARGACNVVNVLADEGDIGETIGYPNAAMVAYCAARPESRLCRCDGPCWQPEPDVDGGSLDASALDAAALDAAVLDGSALVDASDAPAASGCAASTGHSEWAWMLLAAGLVRRRLVRRRLVRQRD